MSVVSIATQPGASYPSPENFSPSEACPEYPFGSEERAGQNDVYALVRRCLLEYGCDADRYGRPEWNPLTQWAPTGSRIFVMPNPVLIVPAAGYHSTIGEKLISNLREKLGSRISMTLEQVTDIPRGANWQSRFAVSQVTHLYPARMNAGRSN